MSVYDDWSERDVLEALEEVDQDDAVTVETEWELGFFEDMLRKLKFTQILMTKKQREKAIEIIRKYHGDQYE